MPIHCTVCKLRINRNYDSFTTCKKCNLCLHEACAGGHANNSDYCCETCLRLVKTQTPVLSNLINIVNEGNSHHDSTDDLHKTTTGEEMTGGVNQNINAAEILAQLSTLTALSTKIYQSQEDLKVKVENISKHNSSFMKKFNDLEKRVIVAEKKNLEYEHRLSLLEGTLDTAKQQKNENNVIIAGLPIIQPDQQKSVMLKLVQKLAANINDVDIAEISMIPVNSTEPRNPLYLLKFNTIDTKKELLAKKKSFKQLYTSDIDIPGDN